MDLSGHAWIAQLPPEMAGQRALLEGLTALCEADPDLRWLVVGCSVGRGAGDALSDLDLALGVEAGVGDAEAFDVVARRVHAGVDRLGGSLWEAFERLHGARTNLWRLDAAAHGVPDPQFGITSILDFAPETVSASMEATVGDLDGARLLAAVRATARMLREVGEQLPEDQRAQLPGAMARFVTDDLAAIRATFAGS